MKPVSVRIPMARGTLAVLLSAASLAIAALAPAHGAPPAVAGVPAAGASGSAVARSAGGPSRYLPGRFAGRAGIYYGVVWGIDDLKISWAESGELVRFSWRVLDPRLAGLLNDKSAQPVLIDPQAGVSLVVPVVDKIGQLRQSAPPEANHSYWIEFSNRGRLVRHGDRVTVVIGQFRAENLVVD